MSRISLEWIQRSWVRAALPAAARTTGSATAEGGMVQDILKTY